MSTELKHVPVALERCIQLLAPVITENSKPVIIDCTLGLGGHAKVLLERYSNLHLIGIDRDQSALDIAAKTLAPVIDRVSLVHSTYDQIEKILADLKIDKVDGILFDLGVSSMQIDEASRGFAYSQSAQLDMRMDQSAELTAAIVLNTYSHGQLAKLLQRFGEEKFASKIAENIIKAREAGRLKTTTDLAEIVKDSIPAPARRTGGNPAKRTFQALRIEVNQELSILERAIPAALASIKVGGRIVVMSYQSLEDRIVKTFFAEATKSNTPLGLPMELPNSAAKFKLLLNGSEAADLNEQESNPRSQSMRLRAIERVAA
jgi:16S rRNA (cytosine1402-N4)-methyltransferase